MKLNRNTLLIILLGTILIQSIIIIYNNWTGFIHIEGAVNFLVRLFFGTVFAFVIALYFFIADSKTIAFLDNALDWKKNLWLRTAVELIALIIIGAAGGSIVSVVVHMLMPYKESLIDILVANSLISIVVNGFFIIVLEAIIIYKRSQDSLLIAEQLEKENAVIKLDVLKSQLNPHFMFNSLNVLSSLINKDVTKAQDFVDEFSSIYRYILEVIDKPVVKLEEELEFARSYFFLQQMRFDNAVEFDINIDAGKMEYLVPPLAVQTLLENTFKHNKATAESPLKISLFSEGDFIVIKNNYQPKIKSGRTTGIGIENLKKRYSLISGVLPEFIVTDKEYIAKIPLVSEG